MMLLSLLLPHLPSYSQTGSVEKRRKVSKAFRVVETQVHTTLNVSVLQVVEEHQDGSSLQLFNPRT